MVDIFVATRVAGSSTYEDGRVLGEALAAAGTDGVVIDMTGIDAIPSSYAHGLFDVLLGRSGAGWIRSRVRVVNSTRQVNDMFRARLAALEAAPPAPHDECQP